MTQRPSRTTTRRARQRAGPLAWPVLALALAAPWLGPTMAWAEAGTAATDEARARFDRGVALFDEGQPEAALAEFARAYELAPNSTVLFNIGHCNARLGRNVRAFEAFERYLAEGGERVPARRRAEVERELTRLRALVGQLEVSVAGPAAATVLVDGVEVGAAPLAAPVRVAAGPHTVEARAEGFMPVSREVTVAGDDRVAVQLALDSVPEAPPPATAQPQPTPAPVVEEPVEAPVEAPMEASTARRRRSMRAAAWAMFGVSVAALGATLGTFLWNRGEFETWDRERGGIERDAAALSLTAAQAAFELSDRQLEDIHRVDAIDWALLAVGVAALAAGFGLFFGAPPLDQAPTAAIAPAPGGAAFRLTF